MHDETSLACYNIGQRSGMIVYHSKPHYEVTKIA